MRDLLSAQVPMVLQREVYASACLAGGTLLYLLHRYTNIPHAWSLLAAALLVIIMRLLAIRYNWALARANDFYRD